MRKIINKKNHQYHRFCSIPLFILISFVIASFAFGMLYFLVNSHIQGLDVMPNTVRYTQQKNFLNNLDPNEKKGFIIGSSQIYPLNATYIQKYLSENNQNYKIYNLAISADTPTSRWGTIDSIISAHPSFVVYGISDRDFMDWNAQDSIQQNQPTIPIIKQSITIFYFELNALFGFHSNLLPPKVIFLNYVGECNTCSSNDTFFTHSSLSNSPFADIPSTLKKIDSNDQLRNAIDLESVGNIDPAPINENVIMMNQIIQKLHENHINLIIFTAPVQRYHLDHIGVDKIRTFYSITDYISSQSNVHINQFFEKYADLPIFADLVHVAYDQNCNIYCQDISKIILQEIRN